MATTYPKSVVILGALSGVARYIADGFAREGFAIVLAGRDMTELEILAQDLRVRNEVDCHCLEFDALDFENHASIVQRCTSLLGEAPGGVALCFGYHYFVLPNGLTAPFRYRCAHRLPFRPHR